MTNYWLSLVEKMSKKEKVSERVEEEFDRQLEFVQQSAASVLLIMRSPPAMFHLNTVSQ